MPSLDIHVEGDGCWGDLAEKREQVIHVTEHIEVAALPSGMGTGRPSVAFRIDLPDGRVVIAETSMRLLLGAAEVFRARYGREV